MKALSIIATVITTTLLVTFADAQPTTTKNPPKDIQPAQKKRKSLIERSTLLAHNGEWALFPKNSVLHIPDHLKNKVISTPGKLKIVHWSTFFKKNHGWIHTHSVNKEQARGKEKINPAAIKAYKTIGKVVIATHNGNPISVNPNSLKPESQKTK